MWPLTPVLASFLLVGCGEAGNYEATPSGVDKITTADISEEPPKEAPESGEIPVSVPRIAYTYRYQYRLVAELVEAERGVAKVNEEIDQAESWLAQMQGRVDFSAMNLSYVSRTPSSRGFLGPIREAVRNLDTILGTVIGALIILGAIGIPLGFVIWGIVWLVGHLRRRRNG
ncbi:DUF4349 domain-containing protein [Novosphingobium sp. BW1]|nr:DUF4349 domain-containing protein [Novosphingobium sp. BW1]